jgi:hypothetical protein
VGLDYLFIYINIFVAGDVNRVGDNRGRWDCTGNIGERSPRLSILYKVFRIMEMIVFLIFF